MFAKLTLMVAGLMVSSPLIAQSAAQPAGQPAVEQRPAKDPNRIVCQRIEETGSRLGAKKVCMSAAESDAQRQADKDLTDHLQQSTYQSQPQ